MINERILQEAARWHARLRAIDCSDAERAAFRCWQQQHRHHAEAYARAERVSAGFDSLAADPRLQALADEAFNSYRRPKPHWLVPAALAASIAVAAVALRFMPSDTPGAAMTIAYATAAHEQRTVKLSDGSAVQLDVATRLNVQMTPHHRRIELLSGRALFDVAHDASRPFSVAAAGSRTTALGTRFQVQHQGERVIVMLAEGAVSVDAAAAAGARRLAWQEHLQPGEQLSIDSITAARDKHAVDPQIATSWTQGRHVFRGTPLHEALSEVNRYASRKVRLGDPALGMLPVGGNFIAGDSEQIVAALAAVLPLRVVSSEDEIILFRRYDASRYDTQ